MIHTSNLKEAARSLLASKQRTILALIGIVIGIGSVIAMVSVGRIVQEESLRQFKEMGTDILTIEKEFGGGPPGMPGGTRCKGCSNTQA
jgi:putative ABC transport system permease protein